MITNLIAWVLFGALAGWIASLIMNTDEEQGAMGNIVLGVAGALLGGFVVQLLGADGVNGFNISSLIIAIIGSVILLAIVRTFSHSR